MVANQLHVPYTQGHGHLKASGVDLITALRKAFKVAQNMTQMEALRQKRRYDQKASTVTLNKGDVVLMRNDQFVGKRKLKDHWSDEVYTVCNKSMWTYPCISSKISEVKGRPFTKIDSSYLRRLIQKQIHKLL